MADEIIIGEGVQLQQLGDSAVNPPVAVIPSPSLKRSKWDGSPSPERDDQVRIKKRIAKPKKLRRQDPSTELENVDTPGAGPSRTPSSSTHSTPARAASPSQVPQPEDAPHFPAPERPLSIKGLSKRPMRRSALAPPRSAHPALLPCRSVYEYTRLNHIEEGTYGIVFRARCNETGEIYALKKLKLEEEKQGFPITSLREVMALMTTGAHENVVGVREIVVGDTLNQYVLGEGRGRSRRMTD
jgi:cell division cycle 2-like protein